MASFLAPATTTGGRNYLAPAEPPPAGVAVTIGWSEEADVVAVTAAFTTQTVTAALGWTEVADIVTINTAVGDLVAASVAWIESPDTVAVAGAVVNAVTAAVAWSEAADVISIVAYTPSTYVRAPSGGGYRTKRLDPVSGRNNSQDGNR